MQRNHQIECPSFVTYLVRVFRTFSIRNISPRDIPPKKNANSVVEIEAGMMKQYLLNRSWIDETILC